MRTGLGRGLTGALIVCLAFSIAACNAGKEGGNKKLRLAFVTNNPSDFWTIARKGTEKAAAELPNVAVEFQMPGDGTAAGQQRIVEDLVAKGIDGMAISPVDPQNQTQLLNRVAGQALVFTQDSDAPNSNRACYIGTDNVAAGRQAGELVKEALPQGGTIRVFVGMLDAQNIPQIYPTNYSNISYSRDLNNIERTMSGVANVTKEKGAHSLKFGVFLEKEVPHHPSCQVDYVAFRIPNKFVVGYGLDYMERYRNLPYVGTLKPSVIAAAQ